MKRSKLGSILANGKIAFPINIPMSHNDLFYTEQKDLNGDNFPSLKHKIAKMKGHT